MRELHTDVTRAILSRDFVARVRDFIARDKVADAATLSHKQTRLLRHFSRFTILLYKHSSKMIRYDTIRDAILTCARKPT